MASPQPHRPAAQLFAAVQEQAARQRRRSLAGEAARYLGAVAVLVVGVIHIEQYYDAYFSVVPTIGTLFLLSFIGATAVAAVLITPARRLGRRIGDAILVLAALAGIGIALGTLVSLLVSEYHPLFGFMESGYRLSIDLTIVFDVLTTALLGFFVAVTAPTLAQTPTHERRTR